MSAPCPHPPAQRWMTNLTQAPWEKYMPELSKRHDKVLVICSCCGEPVEDEDEHYANSR